MNVFFLVLARDQNFVASKIKEIEKLGYPYKIICGEKLNHPNVVYQTPTGKYAAINFALSLVPPETEIVVMNDVDTIIHNFHLALNKFDNNSVGLVFGTELVKEGPQNLFFRIMNPIRRKIPIAGSGELLLIRKRLLESICPIEPCKAEDTLILFKALQSGNKIVFCEQAFAETKRTKTADREELYKRKTVTGIYQALNLSKPPVSVRLFYLVLPFASPLLLVIGEKGYFWMRGILLGLNDYLKGDKSGTWQTTYMN
jgi:hypothetical protein